MFFSEHRLLVFSANKELRSLSSVMTWYMDSNFAMVPKLFKWMFVVRDILGHVPVPFAYAFLPAAKHFMRCFVH